MEEIKKEFKLLADKINSGKLIITPDELLILLNKSKNGR